MAWFLSKLRAITVLLKNKDLTGICLETREKEANYHTLYFTQFTEAHTGHAQHQLLSTTDSGRQ